MSTPDPRYVHPAGTADFGVFPHTGEDGTWYEIYHRGDDTGRLAYQEAEDALTMARLMQAERDDPEAQEETR